MFSYKISQFIVLLLLKILYAERRLSSFVLNACCIQYKLNHHRIIKETVNIGTYTMFRLANELVTIALMYFVTFTYRPFKFKLYLTSDFSPLMTVEMGNNPNPGNWVMVPSIPS